MRKMLCLALFTLLAEAQSTPKPVKTNGGPTNTSKGFSKEVSNEVSKCTTIKERNVMAKCIVDSMPVTFFLKSFEVFKENFKKKYSNEPEHLKRYYIFKENYKKVLTHNLKDVSYKQKVNQFADLSEEEFDRTYLSNFGPPT